ncbi:MAG: hypothetical protein ACJAWK_000895 [Candidatus Azotimanducaceae bacterium]|jgi:hypothetical protein
MTLGPKGLLARRDAADKFFHAINEARRALPML